MITTNQIMDPADIPSPSISIFPGTVSAWSIKVSVVATSQHSSNICLCRIPMIVSKIRQMVCSYIISTTSLLTYNMNISRNIGMLGPNICPKTGHREQF